MSQRLDRSSQYNLQIIGIIKYRTDYKRSSSVYRSSRSLNITQTTIVSDLPNSTYRLSRLLNITTIQLPNTDECSMPKPTFVRDVNFPDDSVLVGKYNFRVIGIAERKVAYATPFEGAPNSLHTY